MSSKKNIYVHISGSVDCIGNEAIPNKTSQSLLVFVEGDPGFCEQPQLFGLQFQF